MTREWLSTRGVNCKKRRRLEGGCRTSTTCSEAPKGRLLSWREKKTCNKTPCGANSFKCGGMLRGLKTEWQDASVSIRFDKTPEWL